MLVEVFVKPSVVGCACRSSRTGVGRIIEVDSSASATVGSMIGATRPRLLQFFKPIAANVDDIPDTPGNCLTSQRTWRGYWVWKLGIGAQFSLHSFALVEDGVEDKSCHMDAVSMVTS